MVLDFGVVEVDGISIIFVFKDDMFVKCVIKECKFIY